MDCKRIKYINQIKGLAEGKKYISTYVCFDFSDAILIKIFQIPEAKVKS